VRTRSDGNVTVRGIEKGEHKIWQREEAKSFCSWSTRAHPFLP